MSALKIRLDLNIQPNQDLRAFWSPSRAKSVFTAIERALDLQSMSAPLGSLFTQRLLAGTGNPPNEADRAGFQLTRMGDRFRMRVLIPLGGAPAAKTQRVLRVHRLALDLRGILGTDTLWLAPSELQALPSPLSRERAAFDEQAFVRYLCRTAHPPDVMEQLTSGLPPWVKTDEVDGLVSQIWSTSCDLDVLRETFAVQRRWTFDALGDATVHSRFDSPGDEGLIDENWAPDAHLLGWLLGPRGWIRVPGIPTPTIAVEETPDHASMEQCYADPEKSEPSRPASEDPESNPSPSRTEQTMRQEIETSATELVVYVGVASPDALKPWADEDNCEYRVVPAATPVAQLFQRFSFSESWLPAAALAAEAQGIVGADKGFVLFDGSSPHETGDRFGPARCVGRFAFDVKAPRVGQIDQIRAGLAGAGLDPAIVDQLDQGLIELQRRDLETWQPDTEITPTARRALDVLTDDARAELDRRFSLHQRQAIAGLKAVTTRTHRAWFCLGRFVALTECDELPAETPADTSRPIEDSTQEGRPGVYTLDAVNHRFIQTTEVANWRALLEEIRSEWTAGCGWRYVAAIFPTREEALALKAEKLRKPYVRGWYSHPTGVYEP